MKTNVSMLKDYLKCPQLAHNLHVVRRGPAVKAVTLEVGTLFHEAMEQRMKGAAPGAWKISLSDVSDDARAAWNKHKLWLPVDEFKLDAGWEIVGVEVPLEGEADRDVILQGRLDVLIRYNGKYWSLQWKTFDGSDLLSLCERVRLSYHEVAYQWLAEKNGYTPWGGTILGACAKLPGYRIIGGKRQEIGDGERAAALTTHFLARPPQTQASMWFHTLRELRRVSILDKLIEPVRHYDQCFGFGSKRCPFFSVCHEGGSLDDPQFVTLEDRYAV